MSKNNAFNGNKGKQAEVVDPVKQAQAEQLATYQTTGEAAKEEAQEEVVTTPAPAQEGASLEESLNGATATTSGDSKTPEQIQEATPEPVVTEAVQSREITKSNILKGNRVTSPHGQVVRPTGGATREASPPAATQKAHVASNDFTARMASELKSGTASAINLISFLNNYVVVMAPRKITSTADILRMQEGLLDNLNLLINRAPAKEFNRLWNIAIQYVSEYKTACFSPLYFSRGARDWKRDPQQFQLLSSLINLLLATARDKNTVNEVVNLEAVVGNGFSEEARGRIFNFYA